MDKSTEVGQTQRRLGKWVLGGILFVGVASTLTWLAWSAHERRSLIEYFEQRGGQIATKPLSPGWLNDAMLATVGNNLTDITTLSLQDAGVSDAAIDNLSRLSRPEFETLERLNLENTNVTDASLQHLSGLINLKRLTLENTDVSDAGLAYVSVLTTLQGLNLEQTHVTDTGLPHLSTLNKLQELSLNHTKVSDNGLQHLWVHTGLTSLDLRNTDLTEAGITELQSRLPNCKVLHSFANR